MSIFNRGTSIIVQEGSDLSVQLAIDAELGARAAETAAAASAVEAAGAAATAADEAATDAVAAAAALLAADVAASEAARDAAAASATAADADATATAADRVQTGLDRVATAADRVATGEDAAAAAVSAEAAAASAGFRDFSDVATLIADTALAYGAGASQVEAGDIVRTRAEGFSYEVAASAATDQHVTTAGGVKLYVLPGADGLYNVLAFGVDSTGATDAETILQTADGAGPLLFPSGTYQIAAKVNQTHDWLAAGDVTIRLKASTVFAGAAIEMTAANVTARGFKVNANSAGGAQAQHVWFSEAVGSVFDFIRVSDPWKDGIYFRGDFSVARYCEVEFLTDSGQSGIEGIVGENSDYSSIESCVVKNGVDDCVSLHVCNGSRIINCIAHNKFGKGASIGVAGKCLDIIVTGNHCYAEGTGATGSQMIRIGTEPSASIAGNIASGARINVFGNTLHLPSGATRDYGIRYIGNGSDSLIMDNTIVSEGTMLIGVEVILETAGGTTYTPERVAMRGNKITGPATGIKTLLTITGSTIEDNDLKDCTLGVWSQVPGSLGKNKYFNCTTRVQIDGNGKVFATWEKQAFVRQARAATGNVVLHRPGATSYAKWVADEDVIVMGMSAGVSALPTANNLNVILQYDSGGGSVAVTGASVQFNSGTPLYQSDFVAGGFPLVVTEGQSVDVTTSTSGNITTTPDIVCEIYFVRL